jgi:hypothetical protein
VNRDQAKEILLLYRPGTDDGEDPEIAAALEVAERDAELGRWFQKHRAFQSAMRARFRQLKAPPELKASLLAGHRRIITPPLWRHPPVWLAAAAALVLGLAVLVFRPPARPPDRFPNFQQMMVSKAERGYSMDWSTRDMNQLRRNLARARAPADYALPPGLGKLELLGGARLTWRAHPVTMVCFKRKDQRRVWLFVLNRAALDNPPASAPHIEQVDRLMTASWSAGDRTYVLAGPPEADFLKSYF